MANDINLVVGYRSGRPVTYGESCDGSTYNLGVLAGYRSGKPVFAVGKCSTSGGEQTTSKFVALHIGYHKGRPVFTGGTCCDTGGGDGSSSRSASASASASASQSSSSASGSGSSGPPPTPSSSSSRSSSSASASASPSSSPRSSGSSDGGGGGGTSSGNTSSGSSQISMPGPSSSGSASAECCNNYEGIPDTLNATVFSGCGTVTGTLTKIATGRWQGTFTVGGKSLTVQLFCLIVDDGNFPTAAQGHWTFFYSGCSGGLNGVESIQCSPFSVTGTPNLASCCSPPGNIQVVVTS